jgi:hypothetical protein
VISISCSGSRSDDKLNVACIGGSAREQRYNPEMLQIAPFQGNNAAIHLNFDYDSVSEGTGMVDTPGSEALQYLGRTPKVSFKAGESNNKSSSDC